MTVFLLVYILCAKILKITHSAAVIEFPEPLTLGTVELCLGTYLGMKRVAVTNSGHSIAAKCLGFRVGLDLLFCVPLSLSGTQNRPVMVHAKHT